MNNEFKINKFVLCPTPAFPSCEYCPECGSPTVAEYEDNIGPLCGRRGTTTSCTNPQCYWEDFSGVKS